jgi:hypothetical protein
VRLDNEPGSGVAAYDLDEVLRRGDDAPGLEVLVQRAPLRLFEELARIAKANRDLHQRLTLRNLSSARARE